MKKHPAIGARILEPVSGLVDVISIVRHHHERIDGQGYPDGLAGEEIPLLARLMSVADVWDSLRSQRPYRPALSIEVTCQIMRDGSGTQFDRDMLDRFLGLADEGRLPRSQESTSDPAPPAEEVVFEEEGHVV